MPKYRDTVDDLQSVKQDCISQMRNEIQFGDHFAVTPQDCNAYAEYSDYLTEKELAQCFKKAARA